MICPYCERGQCSLARHDFEPDCECPRCTQREETESDRFADFELGAYDDPWAEEELKTLVYNQANGGI